MGMTGNGNSRSPLLTSSPKESSIARVSSVKSSLDIFLIFLTRVTSVKSVQQCDSLTDSVSNPGSIASHDANNPLYDDRLTENDYEREQIYFDFPSSFSFKFTAMSGLVGFAGWEKRLLGSPPYFLILKYIFLFFWHFEEIKHLNLPRLGYFLFSSTKHQHLKLNSSLNVNFC